MDYKSLAEFAYWEELSEKQDNMSNFKIHKMFASEAWCKWKNSSYDRLEQPVLLSDCEKKFNDFLKFIDKHGGMIPFGLSERAKRKKAEKAEQKKKTRRQGKYLYIYLC